MKTNKNCLCKITRLLFHFTEEDKQNNPVISVMTINISFGWIYSWMYIARNELKFWVFVLCYVAVVYLLYRIFLLINRKWKFSPSTTGADFLCIAATFIYSIAIMGLSIYSILNKVSLLFAVLAGILLIFGCVWFLYRKNRNKLNEHENNIE